MNLLEADGGLVYNTRRATAPVGETRAAALLDARSWKGANVAWGEAAEADFRQLIASLRERHLQVGLMLAPVHPIVYASQDDHSSLVQTERFLRDFAAAQQIPLLGSYDPAASGLGEGDFLDGIHQKRDVVRRTFLAHPGWPRASAPPQAR